MAVIRERALRGDRRAQAALGWFYAHGVGVERNDLEAVRWYRLAADAGDPAAQFNLAVCFEQGRGVSQSFHEAAQWYQRAAEQLEDGAAEYNLAMLLMQGKLASGADTAGAIALLEQAAAKGHVEAQYALGSLFGSGTVVPQDLNIAVEWLTRAADKGNTNAQYDLGCMFEAGLGVPADRARALFWYRKAADAGLEDAAIAIEELNATATDEVDPV